MKTIFTLILMMSLTSQATEKVTCSTEQFPQGIGSTIQLDLDKNGKPTGEATLYLHDQSPGSSLSTNGWFRVSSTTFNENGTMVNYYAWIAGTGFGQFGTDHLKLIPNKMVTYAFKENYNYNKTVLLGVINWNKEGKQELLYNFQCQ